MKTTAIKRHDGFTLIELLVVIAIIAILAAMLLPAIGRVKVQAQVNRAKTEIGQIALAVQGYESEYNRLPSSAQAVTDAATTQNDITFGGPIKQGTGAAATQFGQRTNSEVVSILMAIPQFRNGNFSANKDHLRNPKRTPFLRANDVSDVVSSGIGTDGVYRDPWGNPYVITLDLNNDERTSDSLYSRPAVSATQAGSSVGFYGLSLVDGKYQLNGPVMIWSAGPDGAIDLNRKAGEGLNKDNILSWKQ